MIKLKHINIKTLSIKPFFNIFSALAKLLNEVCRIFQPHTGAQSVLGINGCISLSLAIRSNKII